MDWKTLLAYISGSVDEELLLRNEYLVAENRILRDQIKVQLQLSDAERQTLAEIGKKLGKQALEEVASIVKPDTILGGHRKLAADKFDGSNQRKSPGRPRVNKEPPLRKGLYSRFSTCLRWSSSHLCSRAWTGGDNPKTK
jgi:hypothetical protein